MLAYRLDIVAADSRPLTPAIVAEVCAEVIDARHFLMSPALSLTWSHGDEEPYWELFLGRALDFPQTRERERFRTWMVRHTKSSDEPLVAIRWHDDTIHVTRAVECFVQEGYDAGGGVFETCEVTRWVRELVGSVSLAELRMAGRLCDELSGLVREAIVGTSRLPLTSLESPLPGFTLGQLCYTFRADRQIANAIFDDNRPERERAQLLEFLLRSSTGTEVEQFARSMPDTDACLHLLFAAFNGASLSPYTEFVPRAITLLRALTPDDPAKRADLVARLVMLLDWHLVAYDLVKFHHRGANYPDALLLDELWTELLALAEQQPALFGPSFKLRRRALRHASLLRLEYAGWPVPDRPTSIGENARVMPFERLPEQQIHAPTRRERRLFANDPGAIRAVVLDVLTDLQEPVELLELGKALFLERPLGSIKSPGESDRTPMLSHVLCSKLVIERRLRVLGRHRDRLPEPTVVDRWLEMLPTLQPDGLPLTDAGCPPHPGVVSLHDALQTADDWVMLRTTRSSLREFAAASQTTDALKFEECRLLAPQGDQLVGLDSAFQPMWKLRPDFIEGYVCRGGVEVPRAGLRVGGLGEPLTLRPAIE